MSNVSIVDGDLFASEMQVLTNAVNCVGVMGAGIALAFKEKFPEMYRVYEEECTSRKINIGEPSLWTNTEDGKHVLNFPTMFLPGERARLVDILDGFNFLIDNYRDWGIESIAVPALGCGIGGLEWDIVKDIFVRNLENLDIPVEIYSPR